MDIDWVQSYRVGSTSTAFANTPPPTLTFDQESKLASLIEKFSDPAYVVPSRAGVVVNEKYGAGLTEDEKVFLSREQILRFLTADKWVLATAISRTERCLAWRRSSDIYDVSTMASAVEGEFSDTLGQIVYGWSVTGEPVILTVPSRRETVPTHLGLEHLFFLLERAADLMPAGVTRLTFAIDMGGKRKHSMPLGFAKEFITVLGTYYPERLGKGMMVNVPTVIRFFLNTIWPFIDPLTKTKIAWPLTTTPGGAPGSVSAIVPPSNLPKELGGDVDLLPSRAVHDLYWKALLQVSGERREAYRTRWRELGGKVGESERECKMGAAGQVVDQTAPSI